MWASCGPPSKTTRAGGFNVAGGSVVCAVLGAHDVVLKRYLHVAIQLVYVALLLLLPGLDRDLLRGLRRSRSLRRWRTQATDW